MLQKIILAITGIVILGALVSFTFRFFSSSRQSSSPPLNLNLDSSPTSVTGRINQLDLAMQLTSFAFEDHQRIPDQYTCSGQNINPPLQISTVPEAAQSLALIVDDPDAPAGTWDHWLVINIDPSTTEIAEDSVPPDGVQLPNSFGQPEYGGPCPPDGPEHRYFFKLYALDLTLNPDQITSKSDLLSVIQDHTLASSELVGVYSR
jgi:Raf kinase inhibitor-like YbhB/YbcL family protein